MGDNYGFCIYCFDCGECGHCDRGLRNKTDNEKLRICKKSRSLSLRGVSDKKRRV